VFQERPERTIKAMRASPRNMPGQRRDRYFYAGITFILGIIALLIGAVAYLLGKALVGESLLVLGVILLVAGLVAARMGGGSRSPR
jgi:uncharacterized membrane protein HdeD (DUF308 family)